LKKVLYIPADKFACGEYRIIQPVKRLMERYNGKGDIEFDLYNDELKNGTKIEFGEYKIEFGVAIQDFAKDLMKYDAIVFQRVSDEKILAVMKFLKEQGKKIYQDIDDDLIHIDPTSPAHKVWHNGSKALIIFIKSLKMCDHIFCSTPELKELYKQHNPNITVIPNAIDINKYIGVDSRRNELPEDKVIIGWTGSSTHYSSLMTIAKNLQGVFKRNPNAIFALCSNPEFLDLFDIPEAQKMYIPHVKFEEHFKIPSMFDINLTPVVNSAFNESKSELKCLEAGIWGVPSVSTKIAPYERFNYMSDGANLLVKNNKRQIWEKHIEALIQDKNLRHDLGSKSLDTVIEWYDLDKVNKQRYEWFKENLL